MNKQNEQKEYVMVNIAEELVKRKVKEMMRDETDMCKCDKCYYDVCALILNDTDARYVTTEKGKLMSLLDATNYQFKTDLVVSAVKAIRKVKSSPKH